MEQNYGVTEKGDQCMDHITPHSPRKRTYSKSTNNIQKLVPGSSKWHAGPYRKRNDQDNERFHLGWKQKRTNE